MAIYQTLNKRIFYVNISILLPILKGKEDGVMKKSKLEKVLDDTNLLKGVVSHDAGMMIYKGSIALDYLILSYNDHHIVYLHDNAKDILVDARSKNLEDAKDLAVEKMEAKLRRNYR